VRLSRRTSHLWVSVAIGVSAVLSLSLAGSTPASDHATLTVRVDARDYSFKLSRRAVPAGSTVRFVVRNRGSTTHDFVVNRRRTRMLRHGQSQTITVRFPRKGVYRFLCSVSGHALLGMKGAFSVAKRPAPEPPPPPPVDVSDVAALTRIGTFERPVLVTAPPGDTQRLFVIEQSGAVRVVRDGEILPRPFLDLRDHVTARGEAGLLSIAFAPDFERSGLLYAFYNARQGPYGDIRIAEFRRASFDPDIAELSSQRVLLTIPKPYENHNGGMLQFGTDGYLYASVGDGDPGVLNPAGFFAQHLDSLLGRILRIDPRGREPYAIPSDNPFVQTPGARPETWAYGLRNPWRFWIDRVTGEMIIADVGSTSREELDLVTPGTSGQNFGWPCFEGTVVFDATATCERPTPPVLEFPRDNGLCAIIGGVVVRDPRIPALQGRYLYGEFCAGAITAVALEKGRVAGSDPVGLIVPGLTSFGEDGVARVYVTSVGGDVYRIDPNATG
jgi:glucose/arabinose dehydrogenase